LGTPPVEPRWGRNLESKRGRFAAPFKFEIWAPIKDFVWKRARPRQKTGFGARDPQPAHEIGFILGVGVPYGFPNFTPPMIKSGPFMTMDGNEGCRM
jgi:hypothetical protein